MSGFYKAFFFIFDFILLNFSIVLAFQMQDTAFWERNRGGVLYLLIYSNLSWLFLVMVSMPYEVTKSWAVSKIIKHQVSFIFIHLMVLGSLITFFNREYSVIQIASIYLIFIPLFFISKIIVYYVRGFFIKKDEAKNFLIIGRNPLAYEIRKFYLLNPDIGYRFVAYIDFKDSYFPFDEVQSLCSSHEIHEIYCAAPNVEQKQLKQLIDFGLDSLIKVRLVLAANFTERQTIQLEQYDKRPGVDLATLALDEARNQFIKRIFDIIGSSLFCLLVLSWLLPIIALIIKMDSKGPVFFIQKRNGQGNVPFGCLKFRTMVVNKDADSKQAIKDDPRITNVGRFLRKTSLDEIPQFINVLMGNMSLIGPRPHPIKLNEKFADKISIMMSRHYVKPGITGLAQCMGYRGETQELVDMENRVRMDRYYIENWTFWLDIKIVFLTIISLIRGSDKAY
jgi:putative colanic acid biosysnthesis UDP-glucose lipid carrier transferase